MKLKLNKDEFRALYLTVGSVINAHKEPQIDPLSDEGLSMICLLSFYQKLFKMNTLFVQKKYAVTLKPEWAIAFFQWFCDYPLDPDFFTGTLINKICNNIHQSFQIPQL